MQQFQINPKKGRQEWLARMGAAARRRCFERFETSRVNAQVAAEYLRILKKKCLI